MGTATESREVRALLDRLAELDGLIASHRTTLSLLQQERFRLESQLRATGWRPTDPLQTDWLPGDG